jgi:predicted DNA-binding mobile mystery protein A
VFKSLPLLRLDRALGHWRALPVVRPKGGWLRAIRGALGMTTRQVARSVGVSQAAVVDAERSEAKGDITLKTLGRYADALGCDVFYALVPRQSLTQTVETQALQVAEATVARTREAMDPMDRAASAGQVDAEVAALRAQLLAGRRSHLWR